MAYFQNAVLPREKGEPPPTFNEEVRMWNLIAGSFTNGVLCNGVQREHSKRLNNGLPILHKVPPKRDYGRYFCIMAEKGGTSHGGLTENQLDHHRQARNRTLILNVGKIPPFNPNHFCQCFSCQTLCLSCGFDICTEGFKTGTIFNFRHITSPGYIV